MIASRRHRFSLFVTTSMWVGAFVLSSAVGGMTYFHFGDPKNTCASCHEMTGMHSDWSSSAHRKLHCRNCHGGALTLDWHALESHLRRVTQHLSTEVKPERIRLSERDMLVVHESCRTCHPQSYAEWQSSRHTTTYARIFLDPEHNKTERLADDCLRCHGQFFEGEIRDLVAPLDKAGPWKLLDARKETEPALTCLACHQIHTPVDTAQPPHFYDRRERSHVAAARLSIASIRDANNRPVIVSLDPRQRLCQQCHAPSASSAHRCGTADDRTPTGVHAGLSCLDCHSMHTTSARTSCADCHPASSHCGLDVEMMDTSFFSPASRHNIHSMGCADCHVSGVPDRKAALHSPQLIP